MESSLRKISEEPEATVSDFKKGLSSKVRKKLKDDFTLDAFLSFKPRKKPNALKLISQKTLNKIIEVNKIAKNRGKKRQKKRVTTLKKRILNARQSRHISTILEKENSSEEKVEEGKADLEVVKFEVPAEKISLQETSEAVEEQLANQLQEKAKVTEIETNFILKPVQHSRSFRP